MGARAPGCRARDGAEGRVPRFRSPEAEVRARPEVPGRVRSFCPFPDITTGPVPRSTRETILPRSGPAEAEGAGAVGRPRRPGAEAPDGSGLGPRAATATGDTGSASAAPERRRNGTTRGPRVRPAAGLRGERADGHPGGDGGGGGDELGVFPLARTREARRGDRGGGRAACGKRPAAHGAGRGGGCVALSAPEGGSDQGPSLTTTEMGADGTSGTDIETTPRLQTTREKDSPRPRRS